MSAYGLEQEAAKGARFVHYRYTISLLFITLKKDSPVYMFRKSESGRGKQWYYTLLSVFFGWWGLPAGPKETLKSIRTNMRGGVDVTEEVMSTVAGHILFKEAQQRQKARAV